MSLINTCIFTKYSESSKKKILQNVNNAINVKRNQRDTPDCDIFYSQESHIFCLLIFHDEI